MNLFTGATSSTTHIVSSTKKNDAAEKYNSGDENSASFITDCEIR